MKPSLTKLSTVYHIVDGIPVEGMHENLWGDVSSLKGDVSSLWGDVSGLKGEVSGLRGNVVSGLRGDVSGLRGEVSGLRGNVDTCEITDEERKIGVDILQLVA